MIAVQRLFEVVLSTPDLDQKTAVGELAEPSVGEGRVAQVTSQFRGRNDIDVIGRRARNAAFFLAFFFTNCARRPAVFSGHSKTPIKRPFRNRKSTFLDPKNTRGPGCRRAAQGAGGPGRTRGSCGRITTQLPRLSREFHVQPAARGAWRRSFGRPRPSRLSQVLSGRSVRRCG